MTTYHVPLTQQVHDGLAMMIASIGAEDGHAGAEPNPEHFDQFYYFVGYYIAKDQMAPEAAIARVEAEFAAR